MRRLLLVMLLLFPAAASAQNWAGILAADRGADWSASGVVGDIPSASWSNCVTSACNTLFGGTVTNTTITNALNSAPSNTVVRVPAGTFSVGAINISRSNVVLRGAGANATRLNFTSQYTGNGYGTGRVVNVGGAATGTPRFGGVTTATWTAGYSRGTTVITLSSTSGLIAGPPGTGTLIFLDQQDDTVDGYPAAGDIYSCATSSNSCSNQGGNNYARSGRAQVEAHTVTAINGSDVTIEPGLSSPNWRSGKSPGAFWNTSAPATNVGIEDLFIDMTPTQATVGVWVVNCVNCWVKGNKIIRTDSSTAAAYYIWLIQTQHVTVRSNYVYGKPIPGTQFPLENYMYSDYTTSNARVENNIFHHMVSGLLPNDPGSSNVYAYNYFVGGFKGIAGVQLHSGNVMHALFEGNDSATFMGDIAHARHHFITLFRNVYTGDAQNASQTDHGGLDIETGNRFFNVVGNVLGWTSWNTYEANLSLNDNAVYILGWQGNTSGTAVGSDSNVKRTLMRWGNWDKVSNASRFVSAEVPSGISNYPNPVPASQNLPASFYLNAKPAWFGSTPFPAIGPDVTGGNISNSPTGGHAYKIPARSCYENTAKDGSGIVLFNADTCYLLQVGSDPPPPPVLSPITLNP